MAQDIVIGAQLQVDAGNAAPTIGQVREQIKQYKQELDAATVGSEQHKQALERLRQANAQLNPTFEQQTSTLSAVRNQLTSSVPAFGQAAEGAKGFGETLKALLANPIVLLIAAIVAGLKFLYEAFKSTREGAEKVEQIFDGLKAVVQVLYDRIMSFGSAIIKLFSGDLKGAFNEAKNAVSGVSDAIEKAYDRATQISKRLQELHKEQVEDDVDKARREKELALIREKLNDESTPIKERLAAAKQLREEQVKNSEDDLKRTTEIANLKIEKLKMERDGERKNAEEIAELQKSIYETQKENALEGVRTNKVIKNLEKQQAAENAAAEKEAADKAKEARQKATEEEKARRENLKAYSEKLTQLQQENELAIIKDGYAKKLKEAEFAQAKQLALIDEDLKQGKITAAQRATLLAESQKAYQLKVAQINEDHRKEEAAKQKEFETELQSIQAQGAIDSVTDAREKERATLDKALADRTKQILDNEKYTQEQKDKLIAAVQAQSAIAQNALTKKYQKEDEAKANDLAKKEIALQISMAKRKFDLQRQEVDLKQQLIDQQYQRELEAAQGNALKIREIELQHNADSFALSEARKNISKAERDAKLADADAVGGALNAIGDLVGKQTAVGKGLAVAGSLINTYTGITKALAQGGIAGIAGAIAVGAAGFSAVKNILSTQVPGQSSGGGGTATGSLSVAAPLKPQAQLSTTQLDQKSINGVGSAVGNGRTFVLESDVTNNQERVERLNRAARLG